MVKQVNGKWRIRLAGLCGVFALTLATMWGCGTSGYDNPAAAVVTTKTATALIQATDLKQWTDAGLVNKSGGYDRVVVLDVSSEANYIGGHIPGAQLVSLSGDLSESRYEGPMLTGAMAPSGTKMDALIQKLGIDANTTIVFTTSATDLGSSNTYYLTRGYAVFRYWGFPKNRLKVLDGGNKGWTDGGYALAAAIPTISKSTYCVTPDNVSRVRSDLRASLTDMIGAVTAGTATNDFIDGRSDTVAGPTSDLIDSTTPTKYVVFEGTVSGGRTYSHAKLIDATTKKFLPIADVKTGLSIPATATSVYTLCRAGNIASAMFFAIDGYAYYNEVEAGTLKAVWYDGSWGQWGLLASSDKVGTSTTNAGGKLAVGSVWDTTLLTRSLTYNIDAARTVVTYNTRLINPAPSLANGNQLEEADAAYRSPVNTTTTGGGSSSSGGGC